MMFNPKHTHPPYPHTSENKDHYYTQKCTGNLRHDQIPVSPQALSPWASINLFGPQFPHL